MKRASYREACRWIGLNDSPDDGPDAATIESYVSTKLVADLFGVSDERVARDVARFRKRESIGECDHEPSIDEQGTQRCIGCGEAQ